MSKLFAGSWKTTSAGIVSIATGGFAIYEAVQAKRLDQATFLSALTAILAGVGLLFARDNNKTSEDVGATTKPPTPPTP